MSKPYKIRRKSAHKILVRKILLALTSGMLGLMPYAYALPNQGSYDNQAAASITRSGAEMDITGKSVNNVLNWQNFSINKGETVKFTDRNNYLNLVRGSDMSKIYGSLTGGGSIYLINPNGVLFGATAKVNVGNLTVSTRPIASVNTTEFQNSGNPLAVSATLGGDITNLGKLQANSVTIEGGTIILANTADITSDGIKKLGGSSVTLNAGKDISIGYSVSDTANTKVDSSEYAHPDQTNAASSLGYVETINGAAAVDKTKYDYMLVGNVYELQNMKNKLSGNYMLSGDIDASATAFWNSGAGFIPIGDLSNHFTGNFNGLGHVIDGLTINRGSGDYIGLFGCTGGVSSIRNVGLTNGSVTGRDYVGGFVGYNDAGCLIENVYSTNTVTASGDVGGIVGGNKGAVNTAYNSGSIGSSAGGGVMSGVVYGGIGGIAGDNEGTVENVYNRGDVSGYLSAGGCVGVNSGIVDTAYNTGSISVNGGVVVSVGGIAAYNDTNGTIKNLYNIGRVSGTSDSGGSVEAGGIIGENHGAIANTYWANDSIGGIGNDYNSQGANIHGNPLATMQAMTLTTDVNSSASAFYFGDSTNLNWRTYGGTTPMLNVFQNSASAELDSTISHTNVQYGIAQNPFLNIYTGNSSQTIDWASLPMGANDGIEIKGGNLTINHFTGSAGQTGSLMVDNAHILTLTNAQGFAIAKGMNLSGSTVTLTTGSGASGRISDYGTIKADILNVTAGDIVLDMDTILPNTAGNVGGTLTAASSINLGYTPTGTMSATVNGSAVTVPNYAGTANTYNFTSGGSANVTTGMWIKTLNELQAIGTNSATLGKKYLLYNDIDASPTGTWNLNNGTYEGFVPIGTFNNEFIGNFNGLGHTINGLSIHRSNSNYIGLFGETRGSTLSNVGLIDGSISGNCYVGGLVGWKNGGTVENVYNTGNISGSDAGGLVGWNNKGTVENVYNTGNVSGIYNIGGIAGYNGGSNDSVVKNAYNTGIVSGNSNSDSFSVGGVVGYNGSGMGSGSGIAVENVYNTGSVSGSSNVGGVIGWNGAGASITNAYWANDIYTGYGIGADDNNQSGNIHGINLTAMKQASTYTGWDIDSTGGQNKTWRIYNGYTTPLLEGFLTPVHVSGVTQTIYTGQDQTADVSQLSYDKQIDTAKIVTGTERNAGMYDIAGLAYSTQHGYDLIFDHAPEFVINKATIVITPKNISEAVTYGDAGIANKFSYGYSGLVNGDTSIDGLAGTAIYTTGAWNGTKTGNAGTYHDISVGIGTLSSTNYNFIADNTHPGSVTINKAMLDVNASDAAFTYGDREDVSKYGYIIGAHGFVNGDDVSVLGTVSYSDGAYQADGKTNNAGNYKISINGLNNLANYTVHKTDGNVTVNKAALTITPDNISDAVTYGDTGIAGKFGYSHSGLVNGDASIDGLTGTATYTTGAWNGTKTGNAGTYHDISVGVGTLSSTNYNFIADNTHPGSVTINKAMLDVKASDAAFIYGDREDTSKYGYSIGAHGFVNGDDASVLGTVSYTNGAYQADGKTNNAGNYKISINGLDNLPNYTVHKTDGNVIVNKATLTITPDNISEAVTNGDTGIANKFGYGYSGLVNGDTSIDGLTGTASYTTGAWNGMKTGNAGTYHDISVGVGTLSSTNYTFIADNTHLGSVTIVEASVLQPFNTIHDYHTYMSNAYSLLQADDMAFLHNEQEESYYIDLDHHIHTLVRIAE